MPADIKGNIDDDEEDKRKADRDHSRRTPPDKPYHHKRKEEEDMKLWGILIFGMIGATVTSFAIGQLRRQVDWFYSQFTRSASTFEGFTRSKSSFKGTTGDSFRSSSQEEAWRRYNRRLQEEYEEEMERVERIRRMQSVFNREKNKHRRGYERWRENSTDGYHQRDDWYWKADTSYGSRSDFREPPRATANYSLSHHYAVLGLSRSRTEPYTDDEIKTAFRSKAKQYHPDQNQENKEAAEARFKEVMTSYEAIKSERKKI